MKMFRALFFALLPLLMAACAAPETLTYPKPLSTAGSLTLYLQALPQESHRLTLELARIAALREDGSEVVLAEKLPAIRAERSIGQQKMLLTTVLAPGSYTGVSVTFAAATLLGEEGEINLAVPQEPILAEERFTIEKGRATALFLSLLPERLLTDGVRLTPRFSLRKPERVLISLKGFVSHTEANSLTVFNKTGPAAAGQIATGARPQGLALDQPRELLYVALHGDNAIEVVEVNNAAIFGKVFLRPGDNPSEIVLGRDGRILVAINPGSHTASIVDTSSLTEVDRIRFTAAPSDIFPDAAASRAFVLLPEINGVSRLDFSSPRHTGALTVSLEETPLRGLASRDGARLYLLTSFSANLLVLDPETLAIEKRIYIGAGARDIAEEPGGLVYVAKGSGEIAIVDPAVGAVIDAFSVAKGVRFITIDTEQNALYTVHPERGAVEKFDLISKKSLGVLETGARPYAAAVMGER